MIRFLQRFDNLLLLLSPIVLILGGIVELLVVKDMHALEALPVFDQLVAEGHWLRSYWVNLSLSPLLAFAIFLALNRFIQTDGFLPRLSNLPLFLASMAYFLISSFQQHILVWITLYVFIRFLRNCFQVINGGVTTANAFNSGLLLGLMTITHPVLSMFGSLFLLAVVYQGLPKLRTLLAMLIGWITPFYFSGSVFYLLDIPIPEVLGAVEWKLFDISLAEPRQFVWIVLLALILFVVFSEQSMLSSATLKVKRKWNILFLALVVAVLSSLLVGSQLFAMFGLVPGALLLGQFFQAPLRPRVHDSVAVLLLLCIIGAQVL